MSLIALGMNGFLAVLLLAAMAIGWRLERRLRAVRDSHTVFAKAVGELDAATARAHAGLAELRSATDEAIDLLGGRLARAKDAADRLDRALAEADTMTARLSRRERDVEPLRPVAQPVERMERPAERPAAREDAAPAAVLREILQLAESGRLGPGAAAISAARQAANRPTPAAARPAPRVRRPALDDDLFEDLGAA